MIFSLLTVPLVTPGPSLCSLHHNCAGGAGATVESRSTPEGWQSKAHGLASASVCVPDMQNKLKPIKKIPVITDERTDRSELARRVQLARTAGTFARSRSVPVGPAQRRELPATLLKLEPQPLSAYDDNPVFDEVTAAAIIGVRPDTLKKWRQRKQGPDYIQYGRNGPVRYELKALMPFRDRHRVKPGRTK